MLIKAPPEIPISPPQPLQLFYWEPFLVDDRLIILYRWLVVAMDVATLALPFFRIS